MRCKHGKVDSSYPCLVFSESDSKLYTNFEVCEEKNQTLKEKLIYKAKQCMMINKIPRKVQIF